MSSLTGGWLTETIRKLGAGLATVLLAGCATQGPNHVYLTTADSPAIQDFSSAHAAIADVLSPEEHATGLAYDFNTDHLFVRVAPTQVIRVIERPSGKILRNMPLPPELHTDRPADLAIRSSDRHLFAVHPDGQSIVELTLFGEFVRRIELHGFRGALGGLAYDQTNRRLLVLWSDLLSHVGVVGADGSVSYEAILPASVNPVSLGYDSDAHHYFAPLKDGRGVGEFDANGKLLTTHPTDHQPVTAIDAGPRSFVRVF